MNTNYLIFGGILIVLILLTMTCSSVTPYHADSAFLKEYTYEGMEGESEEQEGMEDEEEVEGMEGESEEQEGMEEEEEVEGMREGAGGVKARQRARANKANKEGMEDEDEVEGMEEEEEMEGMVGKGRRVGFSNIEGMEDEEEMEGMYEGNRKPIVKRSGFANKEGMYSGFKKIFARRKRSGFSNIEGMDDEEEQEGFRGLGTSDYNNNMFILDQFSSAVGSAECAGKSSGLSNSKGPLCLSDDQKRLLQTRGGNATGMDSQIGGR